MLLVEGSFVNGGFGDTPLISVMAGKCVGGSSVLTGGVCFRIPDDVLHEWSHDLGLREMTPEDHVSMTMMSTEALRQLQSAVRQTREIVAWLNEFIAASEGITTDTVVERIIRETPSREGELTRDERFKKIFAS